MRYPNKFKPIIVILVSLIIGLLSTMVNGANPLTLTENGNRLSIPRFNLGPSLGLSSYGNYVYSSDGKYLYIIDISNTQNPIIKATVPCVDCYKLVAYNNYVYAISQFANLVTFDVSNPTNPQQISNPTITLPTCPSFMMVQQNKLFINRVGALDIYDLTNPAKPTLIGKVINESWHSRELAIKDNYVYMANGNSGLAVIDINTRTIVKTLAVPNGKALTIALKDNTVYLGLSNTQSVIQPIDISNPLMPVLMPQIPTRSYLPHMIIKNNYLLVGSDGGNIGTGDSDADKMGLEILDISNPLYPVQYKFNNWKIEQCHNLVNLGNNQAIFMMNYEMMIISTSDINNINVISYLPGPVGDGFIKQNGNFLFADIGSGLYIYNLTDPSNPKHITTITAPHSFDSRVNMGDFAFYNNYLYLAIGSKIKVYDISGLNLTPTSYVQVSEISTNDNIYNIAVSNNKLLANIAPTGSYNGYTNNGLNIYDLGISPTNPPKTTMIPPTQSYIVLASENNIAVTGGNYNSNVNNLNIINIPTTTIVGTINIPTGINYNFSILKNNILYLGKTNNTLQIYDLSVPSSPTAKSSINLTGTPINMKFYGNNVICVLEQNSATLETLELIDITDPINPIKITQFQTPLWNYANGILVINELIYMDTGLNFAKIKINGLAMSLTISVDKTTVKSGDPITILVSAKNNSVDSIQNINITNPVSIFTDYIINSATLNSIYVTDNINDSDGYGLFSGIPTWNVTSMAPSGTVDVTHQTRIK